MEAQFTVRDTLPNFANWVNAYGMTKQADFIPQTVLHLVGGRYLEHPVESKGLIRFTFTVAEPEKLEITAVTRIEFDTATGKWITEDAELNAYCAELVRAIRWKWTDEPGLNELEQFYLEAIRKRPREKGKLEDYCHKKGCTDQTLRNWNKRFIERGIETGWTEDMKPKNLA